MARFLPVDTATQDRLPHPCPGCSWWQTADDTFSDAEYRLAWMTRVQEEWGPAGLMLEENGEILAAMQFAPVASLPRTDLLPPAAPPADSVLAFCLRARLGHPVHEPVRVLQRSMFELRRRGVRRLYAYGTPLGTDSQCGLRNACGLEFFTRHGFTSVAQNGAFHLMRADLVGLMTALKELKGFVPRLKHTPARPSPAIWSERHG